VLAKHNSAEYRDGNHVDVSSTAASLI